MVHHRRRPHLRTPEGVNTVLLPRAPPIPVDRLPLLELPHEPALVKRAPDSDPTCGPNDTTGRCERASSDSTSLSLPIALAVVIPLVGAIVVFFFLHRRHVKKLRREDAEDKHKSLDFGLDYVPEGSRNNPNKHGNGEMAMADGEKSTRHGGHGMSLDIAMSSPYLLPPGLQGSQDSLHSLSRSYAADDKYIRATAFNPDNASMKSTPVNRRPPRDDSSSFTASSSRHVHGDEMSHGLLGNAQRMSQSPPFVHPNSPPPLNNAHPAFVDAKLAPAPSPNDYSAAASSPAVGGDREIFDDGKGYPSKDDVIAKTSQDYLGTFMQTGFQSQDDAGKKGSEVELPPHDAYLPHASTGHSNSDAGLPSPPAVLSNHSSQEMHLPPTNLQNPPPPRISLTLEDDKSDYGDDSGKSRMPTLPEVNIHLAEPENSSSNQRVSVAADDIYDQYLEPDMRRLTMGIRPLPPDDPSDNPEQRANRIRSFYKEYFDESKPFQEDYYEDYGPEAAHYGYHEPMPALPPFAQPVGRRAMTPPPRAPPQFNSGVRQHGAASAFGFAEGPAHRGFGSMSSGPGPRAFSSASGRVPGMPPRKPMPPPEPLHLLPTPHKLKDDTMILPIDYAPGAGAKERRTGRSETPLGGLRPYSPAVRAHTPLASSFDDLCVMPSPHALRKSGTFTALDFAPPPRFRDMDGGNASDAGSIRSNRTGISAAQAYNVRNGAYRVSRLPPETVGTKDDITSNLRPTWGMHR